MVHWPKSVAGYVLALMLAVIRSRELKHRREECASGSKRALFQEAARATRPVPEGYSWKMKPASRAL